MPAGELLDRILETPVVLCDQIAWSWLGISMAGWNAILSLVIASCGSGRGRADCGA